MINSKKGLSAIIADILILLLVIISISIIWFFIRPLTTQSGSSLNPAADCIRLKAYPVSCLSDQLYINETTGKCQANLTGKIVIQRDVGRGNFAGFRLTRTSRTGEVNIWDDTSPLAKATGEIQSYTSKQAPAGLAGLQTDHTISVAPLAAKDDRGGFAVCPSSTKTVTCAPAPGDEATCAGPINSCKTLQVKPLLCDGQKVSIELENPTPTFQAITGFLIVYNRAGVINSIKVENPSDWTFDKPNLKATANAPGTLKKDDVITVAALVSVKTPQGNINKSCAASTVNVTCT